MVIVYTGTIREARVRRLSEQAKLFGFANRILTSQPLAKIKLPHNRDKVPVATNKETGYGYDFKGLLNMAVEEEEEKDR